jgi:Mrp family chromosome partitioning ATPase
MGKLDQALKKAKKERADKESGKYARVTVDRDTAGRHSVSGSAPFEDEAKKSGDRSREGGAAVDDPFLGPVDDRIVVYHNPESLAAEHFKVLRSSLMHPPEGRNIRSVLVSSAIEQEGKTMVACNLAVAIAQSIDPFVLLVDGDVRRPNVHNVLGLRKREGLTDYLLTGKPLFNFLGRGILDKMTVLQAGSQVRNPAELLTSDKMKDFTDCNQVATNHSIQ